MDLKSLPTFVNVSIGAIQPHLTDENLQKALVVLGGAIITTVVYLVTVGIYNVYFHPLSSFPGPKSWTATRLVHSYYLWKGTFIYAVADLHDKYGPVVRIAPDELSYISEEAWNEIYGFRPGRTQIEKDPSQSVPGPDGTHGLLTSQPADHSRMRRNLANAFSDKALREQEAIMTQYFDRLVEKLGEIADKDEKTNIIQWLNFMTFDVIGDLTLGFFFDTMNSGKDWIKAISLIAKGQVFTLIPPKHPAISWFLKKLIPQELLDAKMGHDDSTKDKLDLRLASQDVKRPDFMSPVIKNFGTPIGFSYEELHPTTTVLLLAGSETTASTLSAALYFLTTNPEVMSTLTKEIRSSFASSAEIGMISANKLKYQLAVLDETMRIFPPVSGGDSVRITGPQGDMVMGKFLPPNTKLSIKQYAANHSELNFRYPEKFLPERWLGDPEFVDDKRKVVQPFTVGPRSCLGRNLAYAEMRVVLAKMLYNFDFEVCEESKGWFDGMLSFSLWDKPALYMKPKWAAGARPQ